MWATGRVVLGLSEEEFWGLTILQYNELLRVYEINMDHRFGVLCQSVLIAAGCKPKDCAPELFFPSLEQVSNTKETSVRELEGAMMWQEAAEKRAEKKRLTEEVWDLHNGKKQ
jgi:hypothetical protein